MGNTADTETETFYAPTVDKSTSVLHIPEAVHWWRCGRTILALIATSFNWIRGKTHPAFVQCFGPYFGDSGVQLGMYQTMTEYDTSSESWQKNSTLENTWLLWKIWCKSCLDRPWRFVSWMPLRRWRCWRRLLPTIEWWQELHVATEDNCSR